MCTLSNQTTLIYGGEIITQNCKRETHEAMVTKNGKVVATGSLDDMKSVAGSGARKIDVKGHTVIPGLIDDHPHFMHYAYWDYGCVRIYDAENFNDIFSRIKARVATTPKGAWILTTPVGETHYFARRSYRDLEEGRLPNRWELDKIAPDNPVYITALAPVEPNCVAMNSMALQRLGFDDSLDDFIDGVHVEKDEDGHLTGIFWGKVNRYYNMSYKFWLPRVVFSEASGNGLPGVDVWKECGIMGSRTAASRGVTSAFEGHAMMGVNVEAYIKLREENKLRMRVLCSPEVALSCNDGGLSISKESIIKELAQALEFQRHQKPDDNLCRVEGATLPTGEAIWPGNMRMGFPYPDLDGHPTMGVCFCKPEWQKMIYEYCLDNNLRLAMLQLSYPDHDEFFDMIRKENLESRILGKDWITVHNHFLTEKEIQQYADLQFQATTTCSFIHGKGDLHYEIMDEKNLHNMVPIGKMMASGMNVGLGSDWGPAGVFEHMAIAQTRETGYFVRHLDHPGNAITRQQAFDGWTVNNSKLMKWSGIGSLVPGANADFAIVDRNPLTCSIEDLPETKVLKTVLGGEDIFDLGYVDRLDEKELEPERLGKVQLDFTVPGQHGSKCRCSTCRRHLVPGEKRVKGSK